VSDENSATKAKLSYSELVDLADRSLDEALIAMTGSNANAKADQRTAVRAIVADRARVLVVQATGWGKSAVYWAATAALRKTGSGPTLVVSPLLALMRDQVAASSNAGLVGATINSTNLDDWDAIMRSVVAGAVDVLLVSPERLANPAFASRLGSIIQAAGLVVIDEAHCISDWGFDFRPDYQRLSHLITASPSTPVLATTATANARVTLDVANQLGDATLVLRGGLARASLHLSVVPGLGSLERYAWVDQALRTLDGSGIVYVPTVAETVRLAGFLADRGLDVAAYSGQLDSDERERIEDDLRANRLKAVVATSALGMGYDKPDLGFCIHVGSPGSPVAYYQQVGRAGRAIERAEVVLLPAETDERLWEYFATASIPNEKNIIKVLDTLTASGSPMSVPAIETATGLRRGRIEALLKIVAVGGVVERTTAGWLATGATYTYDQAKWDAILRARQVEADLMRQYARGRGCLMEFLQIALDDPVPGPCGRCSVCKRDEKVLGIEIDEATLLAAQHYLRGEDVIVEPRKLWPAGLTSDKKGRIIGASEGRALVFADAPGWKDVMNEMSGSDHEASDELIEAMTKVLTRWKQKWSARPVAIAFIPSRSHPQLVRSLTLRLGAVGRLSVLDLFEVRGPRPPVDAAGAARVDAIQVSLRLAEGAEIPTDGPLLVVDDTYRSGWTMTVAASILRDNGASSVMPLVVHQLP
jgi:ATP-dependent DNA helicase RecQ